MSTPRLSIHVIEYVQIFGEELQVVLRSKFNLGMFNDYTVLLAKISGKVEEKISREFQRISFRGQNVTNATIEEAPKYMDTNLVICAIGIKEISEYRFNEFPEVNAYFQAYAEKPNVQSVIILVWN